MQLDAAQRHERFDPSAPAGAALALSPAWKMLLFGDGSPTRLISLLSGAPLAVRVLGMDPCGGGGDAPAAPWLPLGLRVDIAPPRVLRRVWLEAAGGQRVGYASSWWNAADVAGFLPDVGEPIGAALAGGRREIRRELLCVVRGAGHAALEEGLALAGGAGGGGGGGGSGGSGEGGSGSWGEAELWGRWYVMHMGGRPLCVIHEVFSPKLAALLGPLRAAA